MGFNLQNTSADNIRVELVNFYIHFFPYNTGQNPISCLLYIIRSIVLLYSRLKIVIKY